MSIRTALTIAALCAAIPLLVALTAGPQDKSQDMFYKSAKVRFGVFHYTDATGEHQVPARNLREIRLLYLGQAPWLEVHYINGDYSLIAPNTFHMVNQADIGGGDVLLTRGTADSMSWPNIR